MTDKENLRRWAKDATIALDAIIADALLPSHDDRSAQIAIIQALCERVYEQGRRDEINRTCKRANKHAESLGKSSPTTALAFVLFAAKLREMGKSL